MIQSLLQIKRIKDKFYFYFKQIYLTNSFYVFLAICFGLFIGGYFYPILVTFANIGLLYLIIGITVDTALLYYTHRGISVTRQLPERFSNGDENAVKILIENHYFYPINIKILDELPIQFQKRDFQLKARCGAGKNIHLNYMLRPLMRGEYHFGEIHVFIRGKLGLAERCVTFAAPTMVPVYPSFLQLKKYLLSGVQGSGFGHKNKPQVGQSTEFDRIRPYYVGDNIRSVNWRATARRTELMINEFQEERSQPIYSLIDIGRRMESPFEGMTLLDYAINAALVVGSVALHRNDRAGLLTFSARIANFLPASNNKNQLSKLSNALYNVQTGFQETSFEHLTLYIRRHIPTRSLLLLFTNFESVTSMQRVLPYLQNLSDRHLLVVILFENIELSSLIAKRAHTQQELYTKALAEKFVYEKKQIVKELQAAGISALLCRPENLTIQTLNRYIEIKARAQL